MEAPRRKVVSLIRVSSRDQAGDDRTGIQRQLEDIQAHCQVHQLEIVRPYQLDGISGAYVRRSPEFQDMLSTLSEEGIAGVVFSSLDRFFRPKGLSAYEVFGPFESTGKHLFCDLGELNPRDERDQMKIVFWGQMAGMERTRIRDRMVRGKEFKRLDPRSKTDPLPKGVAFVSGVSGTPGSFQYTEEAQKVREAFRLLLKGESLQAITEELKFGSATALRMTLKNLWWIGMKSSTKRRDYGSERRTRSDGSLADGRKVDREKPIMVRTNLADSPLVSASDYDAVQLLLNGNTKRWTQRKSRGNNFLATGLLFCGCGEKMYHKIDSRQGKPSYYICASRWNGNTSCGNRVLNAEPTDKDIMWAVMTYLTDQQFVREQIRSAVSADGRAEKEHGVIRLQKTISQLQRKLERAVEFSLDNPEFIDRVKSLRGEIATEQVRLAKAQADLAAHLDNKDITKLAKEIKDRFWRFDEWPMEERKSILKQYVARIVFDDEGNVGLTVRAGLPVPNQKDDLAQRYVDEMDEDVHELGFSDYPLHGAKGEKAKKAVKVRESMQPAGRKTRQSGRIDQEALARYSGDGIKGFAELETLAAKVTSGLASKSIKRGKRTLK